MVPVVVATSACSTPGTPLAVPSASRAHRPPDRHLRRDRRGMSNSDSSHPLSDTSTSHDEPHLPVACARRACARKEAGSPRSRGERSRPSRGYAGSGVAPPTASRVAVQSIEMVGLIGRAPGRHAARPAHDGRHADPALVERAFPIAQRPVVGVPLASVVTGEHDEGVALKPGVSQGATRRPTPWSSRCTMAVKIRASPGRRSPSRSGLRLCRRHPGAIRLAAVSLGPSHGQWGAV